MWVCSPTGVPQDGARFNVCIAMEYCPNGDLAQYVATHGRPPAAVWPLPPPEDGGGIMVVLPIPSSVRRLLS